MKLQARIVNSLTAIVAVLVFLIGAGAFVLSYDALLAVALANGQPAGKAWIWPLLIDAPLIVFTLGLLAFQVMRSSVKLWAFLVILYTAGTIGFNLSHAPATILGRTVAVVAPLGLLLTTEALRHLARTIIERSSALASLEELQAQRETAAAEFTRMEAAHLTELDKLTGQIERAAARLEAIKAETNREKSANVQDLNAAREAKREERRGLVPELLGQGQQPGDIAAALDVSIKTIRRDIAALNGAAVALAGGE